MNTFLFALTLFAPAPAPAADACAPRAQLEAAVNFCDENAKFVAPARACRDQYQAGAKEANRTLTAALASLLKKGNAKAQDADFQSSLDLLASTRATLAEQIARGEEVFLELTNYQETFVLPIYKGYEEDFKLDPHSPAGQKAFRDKECYGEPMDDLDGFKEDVRKMVLDFGRTKKQLDQLYAATGQDRAHLGGEGTSAAATKGQGSAKPTGKSPRPESTITGVEQAEKKDAAAPAGP